MFIFKHKSADQPGSCAACYASITAVIASELSSLDQPEHVKETTNLFSLRVMTKSDGVYSSLRIYQDLREAGEIYAVNRVARLMSCAQLKALRCYKTPQHHADKPVATAKNRLNREFNYAGPNKAWCTDITYIRTYEGFLYLAYHT